MEPTQNSGSETFMQKVKNFFKTTTFKVFYLFLVIAFWLFSLDIFLSIMDAKDSFLFGLGLILTLASFIFGGRYIYVLSKNLINNKNKQTNEENV